MAALLLFFKKENRKANRYLSALTLILSLWLCDTFFRVAGVYVQKPSFYFLPIYFSFGFGPLVYLYTLKLTTKDFKFSKQQLLHFLPVLIQFSFYCYLSLSTYEFRRDFWLDFHSAYTYNIELGLSFLLLIFYLSLSRKLIGQYRKRIENSFSDLGLITLNWLNQLNLALFILSFFWLLETIARLSWNFYPATPFSALTIGFLIILIAIGGILQKDLTSVVESMPLLKRNTEAIHEDDQITIDPRAIEEIVEILNEKELFLIPDLSLKDFSEHVGLSARETSRLINKGLNMSFIDFINRSRIERFKKLATSQSSEHLSLLGIAYESGFNSKSTFNRVFKKLEGKSPTEFLKES